MNKALHEHLQAMLERASEVINKREPPGIQRYAAHYAFARLAHKRAREEPERKFWKERMEALEARADELRREQEEKDKELDPLARRRLARSWRQKAKLLS